MTEVRDRRSEIDYRATKRAKLFLSVLCASVVNPISDLRVLISGLCALLLLFVLCLSVEAQQAKKTPRIGFLSPRSGPSENEEAFQRGLRELGHFERQNIGIEWRFANGKANRFPELAAELVRLQIDIIVVGGGTAATAAKNVTKTIPIVFATSNDPVASKLVASLANPGENVTGLSVDAPGLNGKRLEILKESFPSLSQVAVLHNRAVPAWNLGMAEIEHTARLLKVQLQPVSVSSQDLNGLEKAFAAMIQERSKALVKLPAAELPSYRKSIMELALKHRLPAMYDDKQFSEAMGLMSYGTDITDLYRRAATYVDRILKGARPADLPIEQPTKFELVINLKTAKQIGLTIPPNVLARADKVIK
jgi:putative ABC transport system substrate-binding protein